MSTQANTTRPSLVSFLDSYPAIEVFELCLPDLSGNLRGKWVTRDKIEKIAEGGAKLPLTALTFDAWGRDVEQWVFDSGDGDGKCRPDMTTLAPVPWTARPSGQMLMSLSEVDGSPCAYDPRYMLKNVAQKLSNHGLTAVVAIEMEFYLLQKEDDEFGNPRHTQTDALGGKLKTGDTYGIETMQEVAEFMHAVHDACKAQSIPIDTLVKESAPSQYEINLHHCANALEAADKAVMLQRVIRGVARQQGLRATFMAKPFGDLAGNGMHIHCSLNDQAGNNAFNNGGHEGTELLRQSIAGCLSSMEDSMLLFAPTLNSYRRFRRGTHAPLTPCWGYENRTVSVRVPADVSPATRFEHRVAGADASPYLAMAATLAGVLHGIEKNLEPSEPVAGNAYDKLDAAPLRHWPASLANFKSSEFITEYFGQEFQTIYSLMKQQEMDEFDQHVTPLEYEAGL